ncbi:MAG: PEP-CTERM sorting domain-containing protein [Verrucomicrobiia bacterium]|jgi:hypothetical protein
MKPVSSLHQPVRTLLFAAAALLLGLAAPRAPAQHTHAGDVLIGRDTNSAPWNFKVDSPSHSHTLTWQGGNLWSLDDPGFISLDADDPDEGHYLLPVNEITRLEMIDRSHSQSLWKIYSGSSEVLTNNGAVYTIPWSSGVIHKHFSFELTAPQTDFQDYWFDLRLTGPGGGSTDTFRLNFTTIPEPSSVALLALAAVAALLAGRRRHSPS